MKSEPGAQAVDVSSGGSVASAWEAHVTDALRARKNGATGAEILRLSKLLTRLQPAAESALAQTGGATVKKLPSFTESLDALSHE